MNANDLDPNLYRTVYSDLKVELLFIINKLYYKVVQLKNRILTRYFKQTGYENTGLTTLTGTYLTCCDAVGHRDSSQNQPMRYPVPLIF